MRISDWSSDVCSSDLPLPLGRIRQADLARQPAPIGEVTNLGVAVPIHRIIRRHILRPLARQGADKLALIGEVVAPVMELHPVTVSRQADRSEERRVGKECVSPCRSRWSPYH